MENDNPQTPAEPVTPPVTPGDTTPVEPVTPVVVEPPVTPPVEPPVTVPDGYVKAEEVETERTARTMAETARAEAEAKAVAAEARARAAEVRSVARDLGFNDPADAEKFITADEQDIEGALKTVLESKSYLRRATEAPVLPPVTPTNPANPPRKEALTLDAIKAMTPAQIADRWKDVQAVLAQK